jgi:hypothetical protein
MAGPLGVLSPPLSLAKVHGGQKLVRAGELNPTGLPALRIFIPLRLSPPPNGVRGLDYPFTMAPTRCRSAPHHGLITCTRFAAVRAAQARL